VKQINQTTGINMVTIIDTSKS